MTGPTTTGPTTTGGPAPRSTVRVARRAVARPEGGDRAGVFLLGLVLLLAGTGAALLGYGVLGAGRAARPLLDPLIVDALRDQALLWRCVTLAAGVLLVVLGLVWAARSVRPERRPDLLLERDEGSSLLVTAGAAADAVADRAAGLRGVARARARLVGREAAPACRLTVWVTDDADVAEVVRRLEAETVAEARVGLGLAHLPVAVRVELDSASRAPRVA